MISVMSPCDVAHTFGKLHPDTQCVDGGGMAIRKSYDGTCELALAIALSIRPCQSEGNNRRLCQSILCLLAQCQCAADHSQYAREQAKGSLPAFKKPMPLSRPPELS